MLQELQEPAVSYSVGYQEMTASDFDKAEVGKRLRMVYPEIGETVDTFITEIKRDYEDATRSSLVVANKETSIGLLPGRYGGPPTDRADLRPGSNTDL